MNAWIPIIYFSCLFVFVLQHQPLVAPPLIVVMSANHPTFFVYFFAFGFSFGFSFPPLFHFGFDLRKGAQFNSSSIAHTFLCTKMVDDDGIQMIVLNNVMIFHNSWN